MIPFLRILSIAGQVFSLLSTIRITGRDQASRKGDLIDKTRWELTPYDFANLEDLLRKHREEMAKAGLNQPKQRNRAETEMPPTEKSP